MKKHILIAAGGTGGHVFPALAIAEALRAAGHTVTWVGTSAGLESRVVPAKGFTLETITIAGIRGKSLKTLMLAPLRILRALIQAIACIQKNKPDVVLGMGGFVSGPVGLAAKLLRKPLFIHEQNAIAGLTNRLLAHIAQGVLISFPNTFPAANKVHLTGNPIRESIVQCYTAAQHLRNDQPPMHVLVLGGSLGAQALNRVIPQALTLLPADKRPEVWHQCGDRHLAVALEAYAEQGMVARVDAFIEDMAAAYQWADLVVCRAGALTVSELAVMGRAALFVPYPHAADDHQTANARYAEAQGAARLLPESQLTAAILAEYLLQFTQDRSALTHMEQKAHASARVDATQQVVDILTKE